MFDLSLSLFGLGLSVLLPLPPEKLGLQAGATRLSTDQDLNLSVTPETDPKCSRRSVEGFPSKVLDYRADFLWTSDYS